MNIEIIRKYLTIISLLLLVSCTIVQSETPLETNYFLGIVSLKTNTSDKQLSVINIDSVGLVLSQDEVNIGYQSIYNMLVHDPSQCAAVVLISTLEEFQKMELYIQKTGSSFNNLCIGKGP